MTRGAWAHVLEVYEPRDMRAETFEALAYTPTPKQQAFHDAQEFTVLYGGAAGGGKTRALLMDDLADCMTYPGLRVGAFRRSFPELEESLLAELAGVGYAFALGCRWNASKHQLVFPNGSIIMFRYASTLKDATMRQGGQYQKLTFDERTLTDPAVVAFIESRLRSGKKEVPVLGIRSGSNPGGAGHGAVKATFIDATDNGARVVRDERGRTVRFIPSRVDDNPHINTEYKQDLMALPEAMRRAFLDGSWDSFSGQVFTEWNRDRHVVDPFTIPDSWPRYAGIDWGYSNPYAVVFGAVDEDDRVWIYDELYGVHVGESEQARRVLGVEETHGPCAVRYADDAMWQTRGDAISVADTYLEQGCFITPAGKGGRVNGWQRVHTYLGDGPACPHHRTLGWDTCPRLHILDGSAPNLVRTLPALPYSTTPSRMEDVDTRGEDHAPDALRYLLINLGGATIGGLLAPTDTDTPNIPTLPGALDGWGPNDDWREGVTPWV